MSTSGRPATPQDAQLPHGRATPSPDTPQRAPRPGEVIVVGGRIYSVCEGCGGLVHLNKRLLGSLHVCA